MLKLDMNHVGTMVINTRRLQLRPFKLSDADAMFLNWANDEQVCKYLTWPPHENVNITRSIISSWIKQYYNEKYYQWAITFLDDPNQVIGSFSAEILDDESAVIGYCLSKQFWNKKIISEAMSFVLNLLKDIVEIKKFHGECEIDNIYSIKIFLNIGFKFVKEDMIYLPLKKAYKKVNRYVLTID